MSSFVALWPTFAFSEEENALFVQVKKRNQQAAKDSNCQAIYHQRYNSKFKVLDISMNITILGAIQVFFLKNVGTSFIVGPVISLCTLTIPVVRQFVLELDQGTQSSKNVVFSQNPKFYKTQIRRKPRKLQKLKSINHDSKSIIIINTFHICA